MSVVTTLFFITSYYALEDSNTSSFVLHWELLKPVCFLYDTCSFWLWQKFDLGSSLSNISIQTFHANVLCSRFHEKNWIVHFSVFIWNYSPPFLQFYEPRATLEGRKITCNFHAVSTLKSGRHKISDQTLNLYMFLGREHNHAPAISAANVSLPLLQKAEKYLRINVLVRYQQRVFVRLLCLIL